MAGRAKPDIATHAETWMYLMASSGLDLNFVTGPVLMTSWTACSQNPNYLPPKALPLQRNCQTVLPIHSSSGGLLIVEVVKNAV